jgi:competence protein ComFA
MWQWRIYPFDKYYKCFESEQVMLSVKYFIYMATGPEAPPLFELSNDPRVDAEWLEAKDYREIAILKPPQPIWIAEQVVAALKRYRNGLEPKRFYRVARGLINGCRRIGTTELHIRNIADLKIASPDLPEIEELFWGKSLLGPEIPETIRNGGYAVPWDPENWMQQLYLQRKIARRAAVGYNQIGFPECRRCGSTHNITETNCLFCGEKHCLTCENCQTLGLSKSCVPLYFQPYPSNTGDPDGRLQPVMDFPLTPAQQRAATELIRFWDSQKRFFLLWAVCGGGKTEVSFGLIARVLSHGGRVLYATPRKDVVIELLPRFEKAFPETGPIALYGGSASRHTAKGRLVLATTHQCMRFFQSFDLVVLDEADAYPYQGSEMLHYTVEKALKPDGRWVLMTATPERQWIDQARNGKIAWVTIPARHHRQPLITPEIITDKVINRPNKPWLMPGLLERQLLEAKAGSRRVLVFLPTVHLIGTVGREMVNWGMARGISGDLTHAGKNNQTRVKDELKEGRLDFLVTSTVFERGITIPNLDVAVLFADFELIYDCRTLVQIAGRAGRLGETASVIFYGATVSKAMNECCRWIANLNQEGRKLGYLDT